MPVKVKCIHHVEIWPPGEYLILSGGMYKSMQGCIFGLSCERVIFEISKGRMIAV